MRPFDHFLLLPVAILLSTAVAAKNCTRDITYYTHPYAYLASHPVLTAEIDGACRNIRHFIHVLDDLNATSFSEKHPQLGLNASQITAIIANATAELDLLQTNTTLKRLCNRAQAVEDSCWPLVYDVWKVNRPECIPAPLANETRAAQKNKTLVDLCNVFVDGCNKNETVTYAALTAADVNTSSGATTTSSASTSSPTAAKNGAVQASKLSNGVFVSVGVVVIGMIVLG